MSDCAKMARIILKLEPACLSTFGVRTARKLSWEYCQEPSPWDIPEVMRFVYGSIELVFVLDDYDQRDLLDRTAINRNPQGTVGRMGLSELRWFIHTVQRSEKWADGYSSPILKCLASGALQLAGKRLLAVLAVLCKAPYDPEVIDLDQDIIENNQEIKVCVSGCKNMNKSAVTALEEGADLTTVRETSLWQAAQYALGAGRPVKLADLCQELLKRGNARVKAGPVARLTTHVGSRDANGITKWRKVLVIGSEGGSISLREAEWGGERGFVLDTVDSSDYWLDEEDDGLPQVVQRTPFFGSLSEAVTALPASWPEFYPVFVEPDFWPTLQKELEARKFNPWDNQWLRAVGTPYN